MSRRLRLLILGATGRLGRTLLARYEGRFDLLAPGRTELDMSQPGSVAKKLSALDFDVVINVAGLTHPDVCEEDPGLAQRVNAESAGVVAEACARRRARCLYVSTDYVFGGDGCVFLSEKAEAVPVSVYGRSKRDGELAVMAADPQALVARVSWLFGPAGGDVPETALRRAREEQPLGFIEDKWSVPTSTVQVAGWLERLFTDLSGVSGILHLCSTGTATWRDYAQVSLDLAWKHGLLEKQAMTHGLRLKDFPHFKARRPAFTAMSNARLAFLLGEAPPRWQDALEAHLETLARK